jgi:cytochrome b6-f complex iron-sulfur subunit
LSLIAIGYCTNKITGVQKVLVKRKKQVTVNTSGQPEVSVTVPTLKTPITWQRRQFIKALALGAGLGFSVEALKACGDPTTTPVPAATTTAATTTAATTIKAAAKADANGYLNLGTVAELQKLKEPKTVDLVNNVGFVYFNEKFYVFTDICGHKGCHVAYDAGDKEFECPCHGSQYTITGEVKRGPTQVRLPLLEYKVENNNLLVKVG